MFGPRHNVTLETRKKKNSSFQEQPQQICWQWESHQFQNEANSGLWRTNVVIRANESAKRQQPNKAAPNKTSPWHESAVTPMCLHCEQHTLWLRHCVTFCIDSQLSSIAWCAIGNGKPFHQEIFWVVVFGCNAMHVCFFWGKSFTRRAAHSHHFCNA